MSFVLGVDGGNTKSVALLAHLDGTIVGAGRGGCGDIYNAASAAAALAAIEEAVSTALLEGGRLPSDIQTAVFSLAGADWPEDFHFLRSEMERRGYGRTVTVFNDALGALRAGTHDHIGVVVACGTGTAIGARAADGTLWHASFWLENLGSGALGAHALKAVYRAELGIEQATVLRERILGFYEQRNVEDLLHLFTARLGLHPRNEARLARIVLDAASEGDSVAHQLVVEHGHTLGNYAVAAARKVGLLQEPFPVVLAGGLFRHSTRLLPSALLRRVQETAPAAWLVESRFEPVVGALLLSLEAAGVTIDEDLLARISAGVPPISFFAT